MAPLERSGNSNGVDGKNGFAYSSSTNEPIAIVGIACRFPGDSSSPSSLWDLLSSKKSAQSTVPSSRFDISSFYHPDNQRPGSTASAGGYFINEDVYPFDSTFFGIRPNEARSMDPQQRKLLEVVYESMESAGISLEEISGTKTGCFVGVFNFDYSELGDPEFPVDYEWTGSSATILSNRLSYIFNLKGPSMSIDTACSSSMYALHMACNSLSTGESTRAIVGGSNMILSANRHAGMSRGGALSATSKCHTFSAEADGYGRAEGVAALILKPLKDAVRDGDPVRAVIRGSAINSNGRTAGITHPGIDGQQAVIEEAYSRAGGLDPNLTGYFECHGTGTPFGDVVETSAIARVFAEGRKHDSPLLIGSIKSNIGHTEPTSALAGVIKVVLALEKGIIPPSYGFENPNPKIDFAGWKLKVVEENTPWPDLPVRRAGVNSFGYGGANAHLILESTESMVPGYAEQYIGARKTRNIETNGTDRSTLNETGSLDSSVLQNGKQASPEPKDETKENSQFLLVFSANDEDSLNENISDLQDVADNYSILDLAHTLGVRRSQLLHRAYTISSLKERVGSALEDKRICFEKKLPRAPNIAFVFTGQGAQWPGMGRELIEGFPSFRQSIRKLDTALQDIRDNNSIWTLEDLLFNPPAADQLSRPEISQPICTAVQIALVELLKAWGVQPVAAVGHSSGEIAAAYTAGLITAENAIRVAFLRGKAVALNPSHGAMLAVALGSEEASKMVQEFSSDDISVACENSPESSTLSGTIESIQLVKQRLDNSGIFARVLRTGGQAYHSMHMAAVGEHYETLLAKHLGPETANKAASKIPMISTVTGKFVKDGEITPSYWRKNLESRVRFNRAIDMLVQNPVIETGINILMEVGPHGALAGPIRQIINALPSGGPQLAYLPTLSRSEDSTKSMLKAAGELFLKGYVLDLKRINSIEKTNLNDPSSDRPEIHLVSGKTLVDLPKYHWNHSATLFNEVRKIQEWQHRKFPRHDILGSRVPGITDFPRIWRNFLRTRDVPWMGDHKVGEQIIFPFTGYIAMAVEAATQIVEERDGGALNNMAYVLSNMVVRSSLVLSKDSQTEVLLDIRPLEWSLLSKSSSTFEFKISSPQAREWSEHVIGTIAVKQVEGALTRSIFKDEALSTDIPHEEFYSAMSNIGLNYGSTFRNINSIRLYPTERGASAISSLKPAAEIMTQESRYIIHPATLDNSLQMAVLGYYGSTSFNTTYLPMSVEKITILPNKDASSETALIESKGSNCGLRSMNVNSKIRNESGDLLAEIVDLRATETGRSSDTQKSLSRRHPFCHVVWKPDITQLKQHHAKELFPFPDEVDVREVEKMQQILETFTLLAMVDSLGNNSIEPRVGAHMSKYVKWIERRVRMAKQQSEGMKTLLEAAKASRRAEMLRLSEGLYIPEQQLIQAILRSFPELTDGSMTGIEVLSADDAWNEMYRTGLDFKAAYQQARRVVNLLAHRNPSMKILEVGAGTGGLTHEILDELTAEPTFRLYDSYTFTDISAGFFTAAKEKFDSYRSIQYKTLNIELDVSPQGFPEHEYDLVTACNVLHATSDIAVTLNNVRKLLKPGGSLLLGELARDSDTIGYIMGCLPGWWLGKEDFREWGPLLSQDKWVEVITQAGFEVDLVLNDYPGSCAATVFILAHVPLNKPQALQLANGSPSESPELFMVHLMQPSDLSIALEELASEDGWSVRRQGLHQLDIPQKSIVVVLAEIEKPLLSELDQESISGMQYLIRRAESLLWVTNGGLLSGKVPETSMIAGLARTIREEEPIQIATIDLNLSGSTDLKASAGHVYAQFLSLTKGSSLDYDYIVKDDISHISRFRAASDLNSDFTKRVNQEIVLAPFNNEIPLRMDMEHIGLLETIYFREDESVHQPLPEGMVEIEVRAIGMNMKDVLTTLGRLDEENFSREGAGIVSRVGPGVSRFKPGDRVAGIGAGDYGHLMRASEYLCVGIKEDEDYGDMATMPAAYGTAIYCLKNMAQLSPGEKVLVHAAAGGVGIAAIHVARMLGAEVYATVGTQQKREYLTNELAIPDDHIFYSRDASFEASLKAATKGRGVDVIITAAINELLQVSMSCLAPFGRLVNIGMSDIYDHGKLDMSLLGRSRTFRQFYLIDMMEHYPERVRDLFDEMMALYRKGKIFLVKPKKTFTIDSVEKSLRYFMQGTHMGKVVVSIDKEDTDTLVQVRSPKFNSKFPPDAGYLLIGCLGGLGRSISSWMFERGARHFVFLSRSGTKSKDAASLVENLQERGARVQVITGDVSILDDVQRAVQESEVPIRGVLHAAMVIKNIFFEKMSLSEWTTVIQPKVQGAINLHQALLNTTLDFFVMTSSVAGTQGVIGQGNYAAANAFLDSFAKYRTSQGLPTISIDLGVVMGAGYVHERPELKNYLVTQGAYGIPEAEVLQVIDTAITMCEAGIKPLEYELARTSIVTGFEPSEFKKLVDQGFLKLELTSMRQPQTSTILRAVTNLNDESLVPTTVKTSDVGKVEDFAEIIASQGHEAATEFLELSFIKKISAALSIPVDQIDPSGRLSEYGMDSMTAGEIRRWFLTALGVEVPLLEILSPGNSIQGLARMVYENVQTKERPTE